MTTAIIGVGNIGGALARDLVRGGEPVVLAAHEESHAAALAEELGDLATSASVRDAVERASVVVLAYRPQIEGTREFVESAGDLLPGRIVIDTSNDYGWGRPAGYASAGSFIASLLPAGTRFVKAFGTLGAADLDGAAFRTPRVVLFYATDDDTATKEVERLIAASGFDPLSVGGLDNAARIEAPGGDLHQHGGLDGRLLAADEARAALKRRASAA